MIDAQALATRIEKSHVISVMEQFEKPGPVWMMPLSDDEKVFIVQALRAVTELADDHSGEAS